MEKLYYSVIGFIAIVVHLILNHDMFVKTKNKDDLTVKYFHLYLISVLVYYISDSLWGIFDYFGKTTFLYIDTVLYYMTMALSVLYCCSYVISFLKLNKIHEVIIKSFGLCFFVCEFAALIINFFVPIFFSFDEGHYEAGFYRNVALIVQIVMFATITITSFIVSFNKSLNKDRRNITICLFSFVMTVTIVGQFFLPFVPLYSIGLIIGTCILHVFIYEDEKNEQFEVLDSLAEIFYSMHVIDLTEDTLVEFNAKNEVKEIANHKNGVTEMMKQVMNTVTNKHYLEAALEFTDLTTLADRMINKKIISSEFVGNRVGWYLASFITMEADENGRPTKVIFTSRVIEEEKRQEQNLIYKTRTDEMTGLNNRRAYEEDIYAHNDTPTEEDFIYVSIDVNGLKIINDTKGHAAGDELIVGACQCMKEIFGPYGELYRIGGDEFVAILFCNVKEVESILENFDSAISSWKGKLIDKISVSYGWISKDEEPSASTRELGAIAEQRMYKSKSVYYQKNGLDRRGQIDAHKALCNLYEKILKINLTDDSYKIINFNENEKTPEKGFADKISEWLISFGKSGQVHPEDLENYLRLTDVNYLKNYFKENKDSLQIFYRRKFDDAFKNVMMEIIPANDYSDTNQSLFLYVKDIKN